jgi:hypothetical protein
MLWKFFVVAACLLAASLVFAQTNNGRISGTVSDNSGAVIPGAAVTVTNTATQVVRKTTTDAAGFYVVTNLPVGTFDVEAEAPGFRKAKNAGHDVPDAGRITSDFKMELGTVTETVVVHDVLGETVNTMSGEMSRTIDSEQVADLALNGRNYMELASLIPGVVLTSLDQMTTITGLSVGNQNINGMRSDSTHLMVDGGMNLDSGSNGSQVNNVGVDFVQQVKVQTSGFSAEYGRNSGASINVVTKAGGDRFHGTLFETDRNDALDAKDFFAPIKPKLRYNDFGWNLGGPIYGGPLKKGRLFFFAGEEWRKIRKFTSASRQTMPTQAELTGDFSDRTTTTIRYPGTTTPIPNKNLAPLMTADGKAIMAVYAAMIKMAGVYSNTPTSNNATYQMSNPFNSREDIVRLDWRVTDSQLIYVRYLHDAYNLIDPFGSFNPSSLPNTPTSRVRPGYGPQLSYLWTISPHHVNEAKISSSWHSQRTPLMGDAWKRSTYGFQFPRTYASNGLYPEGAPDVTVTNFASFNSAAYVYLMAPTTDISLSDNFTYIHNQHEIKAGVMYIRNRKDQNGRTRYDGQVAFNTASNTGTTNYALADAAVGQFQTYNEAGSDPVGMFRFSQYEAYAQDSWKVARNLSIVAGVRYSYFVPMYTVANNMANFIPWLYDPKKAVQVTQTPTVLLVPNSGDPYSGIVRVGNGVPSDQVGRVPNATSAATLAIPMWGPRGFYDGTNLFMPRFSFAWTPFGGSKTAIRGGFGAFHDRTQGNLIFSQANLPPYSYSVSYQNANLSKPSGGDVPPPAPQGNISAIDPYLKVPATYNYNFGIQQEFFRGIFVDVAYVGNVSRHQLHQTNINYPSFPALVANNTIPSATRPGTYAIAPYRGYSAINMYYSDANANYNALQTYITKRRGNTNFTVSYTWSKALTEANSYNDTGDAVEKTNRGYNYGPASFDRRHLFVATYTYRIPLLRGAKGIVGGVFKGWEISGITRVQTGQYLTPNGTSIVSRRSQYVGGVVALPSDKRSVDHWFNTAAFTNAPTAALGNAGVGVIEGPGWQSWNVALRKVFRVREGWSLRFTADAINLMNHPNFGNPSVSTSGGAAYGTITSSQPGRNIQFGVRLAF